MLPALPSSRAVLNYSDFLSRQEDFLPPSWLFTYRLFHPSLAQVLLLEVKDKLEANSDCGTQSYSFPSISEWKEIGEIKLSSLILHPTVFFYICGQECSILHYYLLSAIELLHNNKAIIW
jgi:hypothetical protein